MHRKQNEPWQEEEWYPTNIQQHKTKMEPQRDIPNTNCKSVQVPWSILGQQNEHVF